MLDNFIIRQASFRQDEKWVNRLMLFRQNEDRFTGLLFAYTFKLMESVTVVKIPQANAIRRQKLRLLQAKFDRLASNISNLKNDSKDDRHQFTYLHFQGQSLDSKLRANLEEFEGTLSSAVLLPSPAWESVDDRLPYDQNKGKQIKSVRSPSIEKARQCVKKQNREKKSLGIKVQTEKGDRPNPISPSKSSILKRIIEKQPAQTAKTIQNFKIYKVALIVAVIICILLSS